MTSPYNEAAADLGALGYSCVPIIPPSATHHKGRGKAPGALVSGSWRGLDKWQRYRDTEPNSFDLGMWNRAPNANIGLVLGTVAGDGLHVIAIDVDVVDPDALDTLIRCLPPTPMRKRGAKGMTAFYRAPKTVKTKCYDDARIAREAGVPRRLVDLLTGFDTRQTVVPPSVHPDGPIYTWLEGPVPANQLPIFDEDALEKLEDTLRTLGWDPEAASASSVIERRPRDPNGVIDPDDIWSEVKAAAMGSLSAWVPHLDLYGLRPARGGYEAVATWRASSSGRPIPERKLNLSIQTHGIKDFGTNDTYSSIDLVMAARDCDQAEATDWLRERLGLKDEAVVIDLAAMLANSKTSMGIPIDHDLPEPLRQNTSYAADTAGYSPQAVKSEPLSDTSEQRVQISVKSEHGGSELPEHLLRVPGLVGEITDWICDTALQPQRLAALLAALQVVGTAAGRTFSGPTRTGTHLYGLFLAPSGASKDHPLKCIDRLLRASTMGPHVGPGEFMSMSALVGRLNRQPLTISAIDEFGDYLARINGRKSSPHEKAITRTLRTAWGSSFDTMSTPEWAGRVGEPIFSPALSIFGVSTHESFFKGLDGDDVFNGFLNRFVIFSTMNRVEEVEPALDKGVVPEAISDALVKIYTAAPSLARATAHNAQSDGPLIVVPWGEDHARKAYMAYRQTCMRREEEAVFYTRSAEIGQRLATIRAIGRDGAGAKITLEDMDWGIALADWSAAQTVAMARDYMVETLHQGEAQRVLRAIRRTWMPFRDISQAMKNRMKSRDLRDMLDGLTEGGDLEREERLPPSGGHKVKYYRRVA